MKLSEKITKRIHKSAFKLKKASPTILTFIGAAGVITTAVLSAKAVPKALILIEEGRKSEGITDCELSKKENVVYTIKFGWKPFIPAIASGTATILCIFGANILNKQQQVALTSAYMMLESSYKDYRSKVKEVYGEEADKKIISSIIEEKMIDVKYPSFNKNDEKVIFYEEFHDHFFELTLADVKDAFYCVNRNFQLRGYSTLNELYNFLGIDEVSFGDQIGWSVDGYLESGLTPWIDFCLIDGELEDGLKYHIISFDNLWDQPSAKALEEWL